MPNTDGDTGAADVVLLLYGTLMRGQPAHGLLRGVRWLGEARTAPRYQLLDLGAYPALVEPGDAAVSGELYRVPPALLPDLDAYEGDEYVRRAVVLEDGREVTAYVMQPDHVPADARPIPSGDWRRRAPS